MKNNKGFTLVEILAVVAILMIVLTIITPKIFKQLSHAENVTEKEQINSLINTAKLYMNQHTNLLPEEENTYILSITELKESGLLKTSQILNPKTNEELNGCIIIKYEDNKYKYEYENTNENCTQILVTFDPQGGELEKTTKNVIVGHTYGELPTPKKEGYTFMGWNGKNLLYSDLRPGVWELNNVILASDSNVYKSSNSINLTQSGNYVISCKNNNIALIRIYNQTDNDIRRYGIPLPYTFNLTTSNSELAFSFRNSKSITQSWELGDNTISAEIQLEEGDTATPYEPYYITSDTTVVQDKNHTLKAIWQANS